MPATTRIMLHFTTPPPPLLPHSQLVFSLININAHFSSVYTTAKKSSRLKQVRFSVTPKFDASVSDCELVFGIDPAFLHHGQCQE